MKIDLKLTDRQKVLLDYVKAAHGEQERKYTKEPYWHHVVSVAAILQEDGHDNLIEIALCHDLFEDTIVRYKNLVMFMMNIGYSASEACFVSEGVHSLTDLFTSKRFPDWNREKRKACECQRLGLIDPQYQTVKYADLIDNTSSIVERDPVFAKVYLKEKAAILDVMKAGDLFLYSKAKGQVDQ